MHETIDSVPQNLDLAPTQETAKSAVTFIYMEHGMEESVTQLAERLLPYDVIAMECVTDTAERKQEVELAMNLATRAATPEQAGRAIEDAGINDPYLTAFISSIAGTGKDVKVIDAVLDELPELSEAEEFEFRAAENIYYGTSRQVLEDMQEAVINHAISNFKREALVAQEIEEIAREAPGKEIAVVQGATHTPTFHALARKGMDVKREFMLDEIRIGGHLSRESNVSYTVQNQIIRQLDISPEKPVSPELWDRALIELMAENATEDLTYADAITIRNGVNEYTAHAGPAELTAIIAHIDATRPLATEGMRDEDYRELVRESMLESLQGLVSAPQTSHKAAA